MTNWNNNQRRIYPDISTLLFIHQYIYLFINTYIYSLIHKFIYISILISIVSNIYLFIYYLSNYLSIYSHNIFLITYLSITTIYKITNLCFHLSIYHLSTFYLIYYSIYLYVYEKDYFYVYLCSSILFLACFSWLAFKVINLASVSHLISYLFILLST